VISIRSSVAVHLPRFPRSQALLKEMVRFRVLIAHIDSETAVRLARAFRMIFRDVPDNAVFH
jgi:hypothetical protein